MELLIICEGETEERGLKTFFQNICTEMGFTHIEIYRPPGGAGALKREFKRVAEQELRANPELRVLCLVDLYHHPFEDVKSTESVENDYLALKAHMDNAIVPELRPRFGGFPVVMELETWLLADPIIMQNYLRTQPIPLPETIKHPAAHVETLWFAAKRSEYKKLTSGLNLLRQASAKRVYDDHCPHFREIIDWLGETVKSPATAIDNIGEKVQVIDAQLAALWREYDELERAAQTEFDLDRLVEIEQAINALNLERSSPDTYKP